MVILIVVGCWAATVGLDKRGATVHKPREAPGMRT